MVFRLTCCDGVFQFHLDGIVFSTFDGQLTTVHEEIFPAVDAVFLGTGDVQGAVLHLHVFLTIDGVAETAAHVQRALAGKLRMALTVETAFRCAVCHAVAQGVHCVGCHAHLDALTVLDVYG